MNHTIQDEIPEHSDDGHPGYFGHIFYAQKLARFLGWVGDIKINGVEVDDIKINGIEVNDIKIDNLKTKKNLL